MRQWLYGAILGALIAISVVVSLKGCNEVPDPNPAKIEKVLEIRRDTINHIDSVQKIRIKYIDTSKIIVVHDTLDSIIAPSDSDAYQVIADNQLREAIKWKDSLNTCIEFRKVDSIALDTMSKIARAKPDTVKPPITQRLKDAGIGFLLGVGFRSFF